MSSQAGLNLPQSMELHPLQTTPFPYTKLDTSIPTIRLLHLSRTSSGSITAQLKHFPLQSSKKAFNALSYVWGPRNQPSTTITINNHTFPILPNLYQVLELISSDEKLRNSWWWIDYICIDQGIGVEAEVERNSQVSLMKQIFENADMVLGWLGPGTDDGDEAIRFLHVLRRERDRLDAQKNLDKKDRVLGAGLEDRGKWKAVEKLFFRSWWDRVWTLQEYILPSKFVFYCGKESIGREDMKVAVYGIRLALEIDASLMVKRAHDRAWIRRRLLMWYRERLPMQLVGLIAYVGDYRFSDPRDRIYSVLGMANDGSFVGQPRYGDDVSKVYTDLVKNFVERYQSLDIICLADRFNGSMVGDQDASWLPTWCPDWRARDVTRVIPAMACQSFGNIDNFRPTKSPLNRGQVVATYAAGIGGRSLKIGFENEGNVLLCHGILLGYVDGLGGLKVVQHEDENGQEKIYRCDHSGDPKDDLSELKPEIASLIMWDVMRCLMLGRKDGYLSEALSPGYCHVHFRDLCLAAMQAPEQVDPLFLDWFQRNRHFLIDGYSLEDICKQSDHVGPECNGGIHDHETFIRKFKDTTYYMSRRLMTTEAGEIGMVPPQTRPGDEMWVLLGCSIPVVLRKRNQSFQVVGECYLNGFMDGEAFRLVRQGRAIEDVRLI